MEVELVEWCSHILIDGRGREDHVEWYPSIVECLGGKGGGGGRVFTAVFGAIRQYVLELQPCLADFSAVAA